jgi:hypothetical protein
VQGVTGAGGPRFWAAVAVAVARRPRLWAAAARQTKRLARPRWWREPPFLPVPDPAYMRFRLETQYGASGPSDPSDVVTYLEWCRQMARLERVTRR